MKKLLSLIMLLVPSAALAQSGTLNTISNVNDLSTKLVGIGNTVIYLLVALAVIYIIWNVVQYMIKGSADPEGRKGAISHVIWGIVGLAVILSIWGLVNILTGTFKTTPATQAIPNLGNSTQNGGIPGNQVPPTVQ